jgi:hypothetical protein
MRRLSSTAGPTTEAWWECGWWWWEGRLLSPVCVVSVASCLVEPVVAASRIVKVNVCRGPRDQRGGNNDLSCEHGLSLRLPADGVCGVGGWVVRRKGREGVAARPKKCPLFQITSLRHATLVAQNSIQMNATVANGWPRGVPRGGPQRFE